MEASEVDRRRLGFGLGAIVFFDTVFYAAVSPLLPGLVHQLHLSKLSAGVLTASYPAGTLLASIPAGILASRLSPKAAVTAGLSLLAISTVAFGFLSEVVWLDVARFVQGIGGAFSWSGAFAWIVYEASAEKRGGSIGSLLAAGIAGALFGPVVGTIAAGVGRELTFSTVCAVSAGLILLMRRQPSRHVASAQGLRHLLGALGNRPLVAGVWLVLLPAGVEGVINVLAPLRLHQLGAGAGLIGLVFLLAAAVESAISPAIGRLSDRRGRLLPLRAGLAAATVVLALVTLPSTVALLAIVLIGVACGIGAFWAPAMALLSDSAERGGLDQGLAAALMNLAWAGGQILGSGAGGAAAKRFGDAAAFGACAALCGLTLVMLLLRQPRVASVEAPVPSPSPRS